MAKKHLTEGNEGRLLRELNDANHTAGYAQGTSPEIRVFARPECLENAFKWALRNRE
jgi:hypothetical protein